MAKKSLWKDCNELYALGDELFRHPQLGYKEFIKTRKY